MSFPMSFFKSVVVIFWLLIGIERRSADQRVKMSSFRVQSLIAIYRSKSLAVTNWCKDGTHTELSKVDPSYLRLAISLAISTSFSASRF